MPYSRLLLGALYPLRYIAYLTSDPVRKPAATQLVSTAERVES
jgi:hypothetical protein